MSDAELTRAIKAALHQHFPACKFSVTRGGSQIEWTDDGPEEVAVEDAILAAGLAEAQQGYDGKHWLRIEGRRSRSIYLDRYNVAERAADAQREQERRERDEHVRQQVNQVVSAAITARATALNGQQVPLGVIVFYSGMPGEFVVAVVNEMEISA
jgi:hypothetical protein